MQRDQRERRAATIQLEPNASGPVYLRGTGTGVVASRAGEYRRRAQECLEMARAFRDRDARVSLAYMAHAWLRLADMTAPEQARPVAQQQQQIQPKADDKE